MFLVQIQTASKDLNPVSRSHWSHFHRCYFLFPCFFCRSQFCFIFFFSLLHEKGSFNDTHWKRLVFHSIQYRNDWLAASDLFDMFTQSIKFYRFHYQYICLKNVIHQIDNKNGWLLLSASFTAKIGLVFVLTLENAFFRGFIFKSTERA